MIYFLSFTRNHKLKNKGAVNNTTKIFDGLIKKLSSFSNRQYDGNQDNILATEIFDFLAGDAAINGFFLGI